MHSATWSGEAARIIASMAGRSRRVSSQCETAMLSSVTRWVARCAGEFATKWPDLEDVLGKATKDNVAIGEGHGRDILGHPFNSVAWLATHLASRSEGLKAGQVVMTGSVMKTIFPVEDAGYGFSLDGIGKVSVNVR